MCFPILFSFWHQEFMKSNKGRFYFISFIYRFSIFLVERSFYYFFNASFVCTNPTIWSMWIISQMNNHIVCIFQFDYDIFSVLSFCCLYLFVLSSLFQFNGHFLLSFRWGGGGTDYIRNKFKMNPLSQCEARFKISIRVKNENGFYLFTFFRLDKNVFLAWFAYLVSCCLNFKEALIRAW